MVIGKMQINIVPFYPLRVLPSEDYFKGDAVWKVENTSIELLNIFKYDIQCHGMTKEMIAFYIKLLWYKGYKELIPHTSFGKYPPWGFPMPLFFVLKPLLAQFDRIRTTSPYEYEYYQKRGLKQAYCKPLYVHKEYFEKLGLARRGTGVFCMGADRPVKNIKTIIKACSLAKRKLTILDDVEPGSKEYIQAFIDNDTFVNSSYQEGFSLSTAEAKASGMKLCLSNLPTLRSLYNALWHEPDDYKQLARNLCV